MSNWRILFKDHAILRMAERGLSKDHVKFVVLNGMVIERYDDDHPYPSRLMHGWIEVGPLHVVVAENAQEGVLIVITAYIPDSAIFADDFTRRI